MDINNNHGVNKFDSIAQMAVFVLVLNLGLLLINIHSAGLVFNVTLPTVACTVVIVAMVIVIASSFLDTKFYTARQRVLWCVIGLLVFHELIYIVRWRSPSIQILSFLLLATGLFVDRKKKRQ